DSEHNYQLYKLFYSSNDILFFFSSRRRHTSSKRDWSSDVCSSDLTTRLLARAANNAASLTRLARSAPEKPGVPRAIILGWILSLTGTFFMCTLRICSRPRTSGNGTTT